MIIGVTGTNGAGKGAVVNYLVHKKNFQHYSARDFIVAEIQKRNLPISRDATREVANDLRKTHGPTFIIESLYKKAIAIGGDAVIESIREVAGADFLKSHGAYLIAVDADRNIRYKRCFGRGTELDQISYETFCLQEDREMSATEEWNMNVFGVMERADCVIRNDASPAQLHTQLDTFLATIQ